MIRLLHSDLSNHLAWRSLHYNSPSPQMMPGPLLLVEWNYTSCTNFLGVQGTDTFGKEKSALLEGLVSRRALGVHS